jgi:hypothetical protein
MLKKLNLLAAGLLLSGSVIAQAQMKGPLRPLSSNPRWFTDDSGKAVYLAGSHSWTAFQSDEVKFLDFLVRHHHNFTRLWYRAGGPGRSGAAPLPWQRAAANTPDEGRRQFDLTRFDQEYFTHLRRMVTAARDRGIYVDIMLFEGYGLQFSGNSWSSNPFHAPNNVNGIEADADGDGKGLEYHTIQDSPMGRRVLELQQAYVSKVIDTVNDLDNVLYEIANESFPGSTEWQYRLIRFIREYESRKPKQHPVGMTFQYRGGTNETLYYSPADWISPNAGDPLKDYRENPCADCTSKIVISDTDHLWGHTGGDSVWVWKSFTRGLHVLFMEQLLDSPTWQDSARLGMAQTLRYAGKMNLASMVPEPALTENGYCLADHGREYLAFQPGSKPEFTMNLKDAPGRFSVEWLNVYTDETVAGTPVEGGKSVNFRTPFPGASVLYLKILR